MKNPMSTRAGLALALAAPIAFAQSGAPPVNEQQQLERTQQELQNRASEHEQSATPVPFDQLDLKKTGYLTAEDATNDAWLSRNFRQCDVDGNLRVSRAEYVACTSRPE